MPYHPTSDRDFSQSAFHGADDFLAQPEDSTTAPLPETDLAELTAKFAASTGSGLEPDLAVDLALQMVLHEIVEQACVGTWATGAAIALYHEGELVCRASHGLTAPPLGSRLDIGFGLSGECLRTRQIQLCNDVQTDLRVDFEACSQLGVHSVVVLPLLRGEEIAGALEVLSTQPSAFGERDIELLQGLVDRILKNLELATQPSPPPAALMEGPASSSDEPADLDSPDLGQVEQVEPGLGQVERVENVRRWTEVVTWALAVIVLACAGWLGQRVVQRFAGQKATVQRAPAKINSSATVKSSGNASIKNNDTAAGSRTSSTSNLAVSKPAARDRGDAEASTKHAASRAPEGSLLVYENGREVYRMPPSSGEDEPAPATGVVQASSVQPEKVLELSARAAESGLTHRVEPEYPEEARLRGIQGAVVLEVHIRADGSVEQLKVVSGEPVLADAAKAAVKQWRFKPRQVNGQPAEMQTTITLNFRLPS